MKIVSINLGFNGSTGSIIQGIHDKAIKKDHEFLMMAPMPEKCLVQKDVYYIGKRFFRRINAYLGIITGLDGCFSVFSTMKALKRIKAFKPDVIHLHNLHNTYINLPMLFNFIKRHDIRVIWTLHDCWSFTGHCPHFIYEKCYKWQTGCCKCPRYKEYPKSLFDNSKLMWKLKRRWFTGVNRLTIITPSEWLAGLVSDSYLKNYPIEVINNGINLEIFKYTPSDFRKNNHLVNKKIVLGVAFGWSNKKGLDVFVNLSKLLPNDYQVVLVGTNERIDEQLPKNIISIHRTNNQKELAELYSAADVFVNPTREETFPTVNIESIACGTPVLTFATGGSPETIFDNCGAVIECDDIDALVQKIKQICEGDLFEKRFLQESAQQFNMDDRFAQYIELYHELIHTE